MNGYIEMTLLGRKRGLKFGNMSFEMVTGPGGALDFFTQLESGYYYTKFVVDIIHAGLVNNCYRKNELPDFKYEDVFDYIEENAKDETLQKELTEVVKCFESSKPLVEAMDKIKEATKEVKKKNTVGKRQKSSPSVS